MKGLSLALLFIGDSLTFKWPVSGKTPQIRDLFIDPKGANFLLIPFFLSNQEASWDISGGPGVKISSSSSVRFNPWSGS